MRAPIAALAAAPLLAVLAPAPAHAAAPTPSCTVALAGAAAGVSRSCETSALPGMGNTTFGPYRTLYVAAAGGTARATIDCTSLVLTATVTAPGAATRGGWGHWACTLTLTALTDGTTADAASVGSYAGDL